VQPLGNTVLGTAESHPSMTTVALRSELGHSSSLSGTPSLSVSGASVMSRRQVQLAFDTPIVSVSATKSRHVPLTSWPFQKLDISLSVASSGNVGM
jgi:hypothetical protein